MPIEDVDYLKNNSIKQSYIFLVNSAERNKLVYPNPSNYVVSFTQPFNSVIGLEVLDASIPRTMYNIDSNNNSICFYIHNNGYTPDTDIDPGFVTVNVDTGDYTIQTLIPALNKVMNMLVGSNQISITAESVTNPPDIKNVLQFHCPYPFMFDMSRSTIAESIGFDLLASQNDNTKYKIVTTVTPNTNYSGLDAVTAENTRIKDAQNALRRARFFHSIDDNNRYGATNIVFTGPRSVIRTTPITTTTKAAQQFTVDSRGYLSSVQSALYTTQFDSDVRVKWAIYIDNNNSIGNKISGDYSTPISYIDGGYSVNEFAITDNPLLLSEGKYWIVYSGIDNTTAIYYNTTVSTNSLIKNNTFLISNTNNIWNPVDQNIYYEASIIITLNDTYHYLQAPGIVSLVGEPYVILRCPEIEEHSYRSLSYSKYNLGLAKFRLGVVGFSENDVQFTKIPTREFHPIGRLNKITLLFETASGNVYDFKGVNHNITFAIHYLEPKQKSVLTQSILNPNYNPNYVEYMFSHEDNSSDDLEHDYNRDDEEEYILHEQRHNPQTIRRIDDEAVYY